jgi:hypothetical protein
MGSKGDPCYLRRGFEAQPDFILLTRWPIGNKASSLTAGSEQVHIALLQ